jgi:hypothetical protein
MAINDYVITNEHFHWFDVANWTRMKRNQEHTVMVKTFIIQQLSQGHSPSKNLKSERKICLPSVTSNKERGTCHAKLM